MADEKLSIPLGADVAGLDRTTIDSSGKIELVSLPSELPSSESSLGPESPATSASSISSPADPPLSKRKRILQKTKEILHVSKSDTDPVATAPVLANARDTVSDQRLVNEPPQPEKHTAKDLLHHPVSTVVSKVSGQGGHQIASNLVAKEISHGNEVDVVRAKDELAKPGTEAEVKERRHTLEEMIKERQDMFVRWTMDRHVTKVRILPTDTVPRRTRQDFEVIGRDGKKKTDWEGYANHV